MSRCAIFLAGLLLSFVPAVSYAQAPVPLINQPLVPGATPPGGPQFVLTVNGTGFVADSVVNWNGSARATTFVNGSRLTATILASDIAKRGTGEVTVVSPGPGGGTSNASPFELTWPMLQLGFNNSEYAAPSSSGSIVAADFNGDGNLDLAAAESSGITVYLGDGYGHFQLHGNYPSPSGALVVGDFNGDGRLDLATSGGAILLGNGDGSFRAPMAFPGGAGLAAGDFNGDGKLDLAVTTEFEVDILLGNGDGTFQPPVVYGIGPGSGWGGEAITVGDFNGDGKLDVAATVGTETYDVYNVAILLGNGDGTFQPQADYPVEPVPFWDLYAADVNGDGELDLIVPIWGGVSILLGNGDGTFRAPVNYWVAASYEGRGGVADLNGDGKLDLVLTSGADGGGTVYVFPGKGDGTFTGQPGTFTTIGDCPSKMAFGDFNKDGILDMAFADSCASQITVSLGTVVELQPDTLSFGTVSVGQQASLSATLTNIRKSALQVTRIEIPAKYSAFSQTNNCGNSLGAGQSCTITVTFAPSGAGNFSGAVEVGDEAPGSPQLIFLTGRSSSAP